MKYYRIKNWQEFQHYKDRNPPWIKLHRALLDDYEFGSLPDMSKAHLMLLWLFASQCGGRVPDDPKFLQAKLSLDKQPDLQLLERYGFLIPEQVASKTLAERKQDDSEALAFARSREERREETEENARRFGRFWSFYPRKVSKPDALKAWQKLNLTFDQFEALMARLEQWKASERWGGENGRFIPHPATWLNKRNFEDDVPGAALRLASAPALGDCPCGSAATMKVGGQPRCAAHARGLAEAA